MFLPGDSLEKKKQGPTTLPVELNHRDQASFLKDLDDHFRVQ